MSTLVLEARHSFLFLGPFLLYLDSAEIFLGLINIDLAPFWAFFVLLALLGYFGFETYIHSLITLFCEYSSIMLFETFCCGWIGGLAVWVVGNSNLNENPIVNFYLDFGLSILQV